MMMSLNVGLATTPVRVVPAPPDIALSALPSFDAETDRLTLRVSEVRSPGAVDLTLSSLVLEGEDLMAQLQSPAASREEVDLATLQSGAVSGTDRVVARLAAPLEAGALYLVSYELREAAGLTDLAFAGGDSPFAPRDLPREVGVHHVLVEAIGPATDLMRLTGTARFGFLSCRKAEWSVDLLPKVVGDELSDTPAPGRVAGGGAPVAASTEALEAGADYVLSYRIEADGGTTGLFTPGNGPFAFRTLPITPGSHSVTLTAQDGDRNAFLRVNGDLTFGFLSLRRAGTYDLGTLSWQVSAGGMVAQGRIAAAEPGLLHVDPLGDDTLGTGARLSPLRTPEAALARAQPGDTVYLRPGVYDPFEVSVSGTPGNPITIATLPGEEGQAVIRGDLLQHEAYGGPGVPQNNATRDGIRIAGRNHITLRGLTVEYCWRNGIFIIGDGPGTVTGHHVIEDCTTRHTGLTGIMVCGERTDTPVPGNDPFRTRHITIRRNDVSATNVVTDYNGVVTNSFGEPGGVGEAITVANSVQHVETYDNYVHDSRQYGIDYKNHVVDGAIWGNRIERVIRYGIYLDAGETDVRRISVHDNRVSECRAGIVLAREEDGDDSGDALVFEDIDIFNNVFHDLSRLGIHLQRHPTKDIQDIGSFRRIRIRFNTLYNTNTDGIYRDINIDDLTAFGTNGAGEEVVSEIELIGNLAWNPDGEMRMRVDVAGDPRFTLADNVNVVQGTSTGIDPLFTDPAAGDFTLRPGSPARAVVSGQSVAPFDRDASGAARGALANAGAY